MTYSQFKLELGSVRKNRKQIRSIMREIQSLPDDILSTTTPGAIDYSKDRVQASSDPDAKLINAIYKVDRDTLAKIKKIEDLLQKNEHLEQMIYEEDGVEAEILRLYTIEGMNMEKVGNHLNYSTSHCWKLWHIAAKRIYEKEEKE